MTKIKICGIRTPAEAEYLNQYSVDYAGIVLYEKSKRHVPFSKVQDVIKKLNHNIIKVAVAVSPHESVRQKVAQEGFDILQVHGDCEKWLLKHHRDKLKIWRAINVENINDLLYFDWEEAKRFDAIVLDAKNYGSGRTFGWDTENQTEILFNFREKLRTQDISFILAGGLNADNVKEGIRLFSPDIVDVSSGVENETGKDKDKIKNFVKQVKNI